MLVTQAVLPEATQKYTYPATILITTMLQAKFFFLLAEAAAAAPLAVPILVVMLVAEAVQAKAVRLLLAEVRVVTLTLSFKVRVLVTLCLAEEGLATAQRERVMPNMAGVAEVREDVPHRQEHLAEVRYMAERAEVEAEIRLPVRLSQAVRGELILPDRAVRLVLVEGQARLVHRVLLVLVMEAVVDMALIVVLLVVQEGPEVRHRAAAVEARVLLTAQAAQAAQGV